MPTFWQRNRRRAVALAAAGAAGAAAAYYVYWWLWSADDDGDGDAGLLDDADRPSTSGADGGDELRPGVLIDPRGGPGAAALDAQSHLQHHFDSIQEIADATTIPSLLPALARALAAAGEVEASLQRLRTVKAGGPAAALAREEKRALWEGLAAGSLGRLAAACCALPLLDLQVRVQLNVLGRHLYLQSSLAGQEQQQQSGWGGVEGGTLGLPPSTPLRPLSAPSQEAFLSFSEHLAKAGVVALAEQAQAAAAAALKGVSLELQLDAAAVEALFSDVMAALSKGAAAAGWATYLLPSPAQLRESLRLTRPDNRAMLPQADALLVDSDAVGAMLGEVGRIVISERFDVAVTTGAKAAARLAAQRLSGRLGGGSLPLAKLVPQVVAEAAEVLTPGGEYSAQLAASPAVRALCAAVYSCGPPL